jgi:hypothetical protein
MIRYELIAPKSSIKNFTSKADQAYFSKPVPVEIVKKCENGLWIVKDTNCGTEFPVSPKNLKAVFPKCKKVV